MTRAFKCPANAPIVVKMIYQLKNLIQRSTFFSSDIGIFSPRIYYHSLWHLWHLKMPFVQVSSCILSLFGQQTKVIILTRKSSSTPWVMQAAWTCTVKQMPSYVSHQNIRKNVVAYATKMSKEKSKCGPLIKNDHAALSFNSYP